MRFEYIVGCDPDILTHFLKSTKEDWVNLVENESPELVSLY